MPDDFTSYQGRASGWEKFENYLKSKKYFFKVLKNDFFLCGCIEEFQENARLFIFETFCRIHQCISIK